MIDPRIFRAYDIRGVAHTQLTADACRSIGHAFGDAVKKKYGLESPTVCLGRDARTHSPELEEAACEGLVAAGCTVLRIGQTPSPVNYFTVCIRELDAGMQITASHNPKEDNGIKLCTRSADAFSGDNLQTLRKNIEAGLRPSAKKGSAEKIDGVTPYIEFLATLFHGVGDGVSVVVDGGNGVAGPAYCELLRRVGCSVTELYTEPDGTFPNHAADPSKHATLKELQAKVTSLKAHCGFAFDGDGDRMGLVDEKGKIVTADETMLLLAKDHLSRHPGAPVIFTVSNSSLLETEVKKWGGKPVMCKVGHSFVEHTMREHNALLGGEQSGHFFCGEDYYGFDDAAASALRILLVMKHGKGPLSEHIAEFPRVYQMQEKRPSCPDDLKADIVKRATEHFAKKYPTVTLDGARIDFGDGAWAGIRFSNTSPCLSICIEARSEKKLKHVEEEVLEHMRTYSDVKL